MFAASVINIFTDFLATVIPMPLIWSLKLPTRQRIAVISIFGLGIFVNVAGCCRTVYVYKSMIASYDSTWLGWPVLLSAGVEINLGLVCLLTSECRISELTVYSRSVHQRQHYAHWWHSSFLASSSPPATTLIPMAGRASRRSSARRRVRRRTLSISWIRVRPTTALRLCGQWRWRLGPKRGNRAIAALATSTMLLPSLTETLPLTVLRAKIQTGCMAHQTAANRQTRSPPVSRGIHHSPTSTLSKRMPFFL